MWFKNLRVYSFTEPFQHAPEKLAKKLEAFAFQPCGSLDPVKYGWVPPLGRHGEELIHAANRQIMLCAKRQEKVLPSAVIREALEEKVLEISSAEGRHVGRAEKQTLKDEIIFTLMPRALAKSSCDFAYIDTINQFLIVNSSSAKRAEDLLSTLRESIGSLKIIPLTGSQAATDVLTHWLKSGQAAKNFVLGEECELFSPKDGRNVKFKYQDLNAEEVLSHLDSGLLVRKLSVHWREAIECIIDDQLSFKRLKYADTLLERVDDQNAETVAEQFDMEFAIMAAELGAFLIDVGLAFGGLVNEVSDHPASPSTKTSTKK